MVQLSNEQSIFLKAQGISPSLLFDATGLNAKDRKLQMTSLQKQFYYGGAPCKAYGHTLRTKSGHCIQCDRSKIAYQLRSSSKGYVYVAQSLDSGYIKVGFSEYDPDSRELSINTVAYGNIRDWQIIKSIKVEENAGRKEFRIHEDLAKYQKLIKYEKNRGEQVECREIFQCSLGIALAAFDKIIFD